MFMGKSLITFIWRVEDRSIKSNYNNSLVDTQYKKRVFPDSSAVKNPHANAGDAGDSGSAPW